MKLTPKQRAELFTRMAQAMAASGELAEAMKGLDVQTKLALINAAKQADPRTFNRWEEYDNMPYEKLEILYLQKLKGAGIEP